MFQEHPEFQTPSDDTVIWRYMDFTKFISLLENQALFFTRGDRFPDSFEGSLPKRNADDRSRLYLALQELEDLPVDDRQLGDAELGRLALHDRRFVAMNCWHINPNESDAMWKLYLKGDGVGVAIRSTVDRLNRSIIDDRKVHIGTVRYIDYDTESFEVKSRFSRFLHKRSAFSHERELRALVEIEADSTNRSERDPTDYFGYFARKPIVTHGLQIKIALDVLIDEVRVAPTNSWLESLTQSVVQRYGLCAPVRRAELARDPIF